MIIQQYSNIINKINFSELNNKKILITGASGLIGVHLISSLKEISKIFNFKIYAWIKNDIDPLFKDIFEGCEIIKSDITNQDVFINLPHFDYIIHASGYGQPNKFLIDKVKTITLNTSSTINLINKLNDKGKFLFVSTSELYSGLDKESLTEDDIGITNTNHPRSCYIDGKRCGESICYSYIEKNIDIKIARLSLAYGPGTKHDDVRILNVLVQRALTCDTINLADDGSAIRTYCYITDVIEMFWNILLFGKYRVYNIGGKSKVSILELANEIGKFVNKKITLPNKTLQLNGSPKLVNMSIDRYQNEFNKKEFTPLNIGLEKTIKWQKKLYNIDI